MAATGVSVADAVVEQFTDFKKSSNKTTFITYKIDNGQIVTEHTSGEGETFESFLSFLPADDCRYAIYSMDFTTTDGRPANKLVSISWYVNFNFTLRSDPFCNRLAASYHQ